MNWLQTGSVFKINQQQDATTSLARWVHAGGGQDTLKITGTGTLMDLRKFSSFYTNTKLQGFEIVDMESDSAAQTFIADATAIASFGTGGSLSNGYLTGGYQLVVRGNSGDKLMLPAGDGYDSSGWVLKNTNVPLENSTTDMRSYNLWYNQALDINVLVASTVTVTLSVAPVVLDLNGDGALSYGKTVMDVNGDGHLDLTAWAARQDGVLVRDANRDGKVSGAAEFVFARHGGETDLQGLAAQFDSNHDGVLDTLDAQFGEFGVWQDANGNGVTDAGELKSLADVGITSIHLHSDGVVRTPADGVTEAGRSSATLADGSKMLVADASFAYQLASAEDMAADAPAKVVKLTLSDVLAAPIDSAGLHQLVLTGDANDSVELRMSDWTDTGASVTQAGRTYEVFHAAFDAHAQLLIDQHMVNPTLWV